MSGLLCLPFTPSADFRSLHGSARHHGSSSSAGPGPSSCPIHPACPCLQSWFTQGPGPASESDVFLLQSLPPSDVSILQSPPPYFRVRYNHGSSYFRVRNSHHLTLSPHINHISRIFSTQIITFPGFIPSKNTVSVFLLQERSSKPVKNTIFHICQKITYFDIFHLFCHFPGSVKITHFLKNTKITYFHYFPIRWRFCDFPHSPQIPKNHQNGKFAKNGDFLENGQNQENQEMGKIGRSQKPQKCPKCQKWGNWGFCPYTPKMGILRLRLTNTPHTLDVRIFLN